MSVTADQPAPYAPASAVLSLIERHRAKGLPSPVDADVLGRAGISSSLIPRTLQALQALDLITEDGKPSPVLEGIRLAPEAEYKQRMAEWLNAAYADALAFVDPAKDDETAIRDAFRSYKPVGQQARMVTLFMGLFTAAGVMPERQKQAPRIVTNAAQRLTRHNAKPKTGGGSGDRKPREVGVGGIPPALAGLLQSLPAEGIGWTQAKRDSFHNAFGVMLDFCFPIRETEPEPANGNGG